MYIVVFSNRNISVRVWFKVRRTTRMEGLLKNYPLAFYVLFRKKHPENARVFIRQRSSGHIPHSASPATSRTALVRLPPAALLVVYNGLQMWICEMKLIVLSLRLTDVASERGERISLSAPVRPPPVALTWSVIYSTFCVRRIREQIRSVSTVESRYNGLLEICLKVHYSQVSLWWTSVDWPESLL